MEAINVLQMPLVESDKSITPLLYIKLRLAKNFVKVQLYVSDAFRYPCNNFPELSYVKVSSQIKKTMADSHSQDLLGGTEKEAWVAFNCVEVHQCERADGLQSVPQNASPRLGSRLLPRESWFNQ
ncbi:hypothetical protein J437_LFUL014125 [Ladona fulva]|uniref:Uncharacterized protein n=1 Tax=Ladona fulva TaxID=123851 RepID=A0A8K0KK01_LADFU|nr:hypothetical protein J437_LFUL014125 [Ladona fulva]